MQRYSDFLEHRTNFDLISEGSMIDENLLDEGIFGDAMRGIGKAFGYGNRAKKRDQAIDWDEAGRLAREREARRAGGGGTGTGSGVGSGSGGGGGVGAGSPAGIGAGSPAGIGAGSPAGAGGGDAGRHERNLVALRKQLTGHGADHSRISDEKLKPYLQHIITKIPPQNHKKAVEKLAQNIMRQQVGSTGGASNMGGGARLSQTGGAYSGQAPAGSGITGKYTFGLTDKPTGGPRISPAADNLTMSPYKVADRQASAGGGISFGPGVNRSVSEPPPSPSRLASGSLADIESGRPNVVQDRKMAAYDAYMKRNQKPAGVGSAVNFIPQGEGQGLRGDIHTNSPERPAMKWDDEHQVANGNFLSSPSSMGGISFSSGSRMRKR